MNGLRKLVFGFFIGTLVLGGIALGGVAFMLDRMTEQGWKEEREATTTPRRTGPNAKCHACNRRFSIPEEHRGTIAEWTREYRCPNCGISFHAGILYKNADEKKPAE